VVMAADPKAELALVKLARERDWEPMVPPASERE